MLTRVLSWLALLHDRGGDRAQTVQLAQVACIGYGSF
ncbi:MAG: hypothetical protein K0R44_3717 [Thermomicrobiales bacterium]|jgi:hypothetical protein|nr:hypothetical protein [Thermomicrobiales bacterium]